MGGGWNLNVISFSSKYLPISEKASNLRETHLGDLKPLGQKACLDHRQKICKGLDTRENMVSHSRGTDGRVETGQGERSGREELNRGKLWKPFSSYQLHPEGSGETTAAI